MRERARLSTAFIAVGSNIEPRPHILAALTALSQRTRVVSSSTFYRTVPVGPATQPPYINGVWEICAARSPAQIRGDLLRPIESELGRRRLRDKFAPRTIDLDLVLYDDLIVDDGDLRLPHPDLVRPFVCGPVRELLEEEGSDVEPDLRRRILQLLPPAAQATAPGEVLEDLTRQLRQRLS